MILRLEGTAIACMKFLSWITGTWHLKPNGLCHCLFVQNYTVGVISKVKELFERHYNSKQLSSSSPGDLIGTVSVMIRVKEIFEGHNNLISGFNIFLQKGYEIALDNDEALPQEKTVECQEAISFVKKIKIRFQNDVHIYKAFLDIWNMYWNEHKDIIEVYSEISSLFNGHLDLLDEFRRFLLEAAYLSAEHVGM
ncbi:paired amphipathic helix protein Sin3-like 1 [Quercus suber]|uniref:paired amphipathic helix protein Sin3-like 1 n=1 Tax=Quercus suber TaxID=58331 RepID=UPI0032DF512A